MTIEQSHGKARVTLPRSRDLEDAPTGPRPGPARDALGRVRDSQAARELAQGRGCRELTSRLAGRDLEAASVELGRASQRLYRGLLRELPYDGPQVRVLVAAQARSAVLAGWYTQRGAELGLGTDEGRKAIELAAKLDARAERLSISSLDIATRLAKADRERNGGPTIIELIEQEAAAELEAERAQQAEAEAERANEAAPQEDPCT